LDHLFWHTVYISTWTDCETKKVAMATGSTAKTINKKKEI